MASKRDETMVERRARSLAERHSYQVGRHLVRLSEAAGGWTVTVDGLRHGRRFPTEAAAWSAGLLTAEALDRTASEEDGSGQDAGGTGQGAAAGE